MSSRAVGTCARPRRQRCRAMRDTRRTAPRPTPAGCRSCRRRDAARRSSRPVAEQRARALLRSGHPRRAAMPSGAMRVTVDVAARVDAIGARASRAPVDRDQRRTAHRWKSPECPEPGPARTLRSRFAAGQVVRPVAADGRGVSTRAAQALRRYQRAAASSSLARASTQRAPWASVPSSRTARGSSGSPSRIGTHRTPRRGARSVTTTSTIGRSGASSPTRWMTSASWTSKRAPRLGDDRLERLLGHARVVLERQRRHGCRVVHVAHGADERRDRADARGRPRAARRSPRPTSKSSAWTRTAIASLPPAAPGLEEARPRRRGRQHAGSSRPAPPA